MAIRPGSFLCGCNPIDKQHYGRKRFDAQNFEVCPQHGERLYGWATPHVYKPGLGNVIDYSKQGTGGSVNINPLVIEDRRDNSDPQEVGAVLLAKANGHG